VAAAPVAGHCHRPALAVRVSRPDRCCRPPGRDRKQPDWQPYGFAHRRQPRTFRRPGHATDATSVSDSALGPHDDRHTKWPPSASSTHIQCRDAILRVIPQEPRCRLPVLLYQRHSDVVGMSAPTARQAAAKSNGPSAEDPDVDGSTHGATTTGAWSLSRLHRTGQPGDAKKPWTPGLIKRRKSLHEPALDFEGVASDSRLPDCRFAAINQCRICCP
jgi:hypothetical protein